ncbi:hypothetical protein [Desulforamulus ruminis]|uniref:hypothetical protein n=1 Tax=Desulforamulus ruminis TaxID=1564 RepID=UPI00235496E4|nr:hypothetical protein [Desulforamulus ruminis]
MDDKTLKYYKENTLYRGHRFIPPDAGEIYRNSCQDCKFFVNVVGQQETRRICVAEVKAYRSRAKRVPESIEILDLILMLGKEALERMIRKGQGQEVARGEFEPII